MAMDLDARAWYALNQVSGLGPKALASLARSLADQRRGASSLLGATPADLAAAGIKERLAEAAARILDDPPDVPALPEGATIVTPDHDAFPQQRLGSPLGSAVVLFCAGDLSLLGAPGVAVAGSRDAHPDPICFAEAFVDGLGRSNVVTGAAAGIDETAHRVATGSGGTATAVLAEGIAVPGGKGQQLLGADGVLVVSEFDPSARWSRFQAMARNRTISWLADAVVVVAAGIKGGSWEQGQLCLKAGVPLFIPDFPEDVAPGNRRLIIAGAIPLDVRDPAGAASIVLRGPIDDQLSLLR